MEVQMRLTFAAAIAASLIVAPSLLSSASADTMKNCSANWKAMSAADKAKTTYKDYSATCLKGGAATPAKAAAPAPMAAPTKMAAPAKTAAPATAMKAAASTGGAAPAGATGQCKDGSYTMSKSHSGACSSHGGVAKWL
jgi:hypothetical protein